MGAACGSGARRSPPFTREAETSPGLPLQPQTPAPPLGPRAPWRPRRRPGRVVRAGPHSYIFLDCSLSLLFLLSPLYTPLPTVATLCCPWHMSLCFRPAKSVMFGYFKFIRNKRCSGNSLGAHGWHQGRGHRILHVPCGSQRAPTCHVPRCAQVMPYLWMRNLSSSM